MKVLNMSSTRPFCTCPLFPFCAPFKMARISGSTSVMKTIGRTPSASAVWLISRST
jgi:hypothetical protein